MSRLASGAPAATASPSGAGGPRRAAAIGAVLVERGVTLQRLRIERACDDAERCGSLREGIDPRHTSEDSVCFLSSSLGDRRPATVNVPRHSARRTLALHFALRRPTPGTR
jgi:hypothetical protein